MYTVINRWERSQQIIAQPEVDFKTELFCG